VNISYDAVESVGRDQSLPEAPGAPLGMVGKIGARFVQPLVKHRGQVPQCVVDIDDDSSHGRSLYHITGYFKNSLNERGMTKNGNSYLDTGEVLL
jgi:hypothetical protein